MVPLGSEVGLSVIAWHLTEMVYCRLPVHPRVSVAWMVNEKLPSVVGVPERSPLDERVSPLGKVPFKTTNV